MKTVDELTHDELNKLRSRWYHQHLDDGSLNEVMGIDDGEIICENDVPLDIVKTYYEDTFFVEEDFFCNF